MKPVGFHHAAVLGAGTMGAQIAAHFANAGVRTTAPRRQRRTWRARDWRAPASRSRTRSSLTGSPSLITTGGFDTDLDVARACRLDHRGDRRAARRQARAARARRRGPAPRHDRFVEHVGHSDRGARRTAAATTSGAHWLGTHFFNPPRYLHLLELIPTAGHRSATSSRESRSSPIGISAKASWSRRTRRTSSPTTSASTA